MRIPAGAAIFAMVMATPAAAQRAISPPTVAPPEIERLWAHLQSWAGWVVDTGVSPTLRVSMSQPQWRTAANSSPGAAFYLSAFASSTEWTVPPLSVLEGESLSCGGFKATPSAVMLQLEGKLERSDWAKVMPALRPGERYVVYLQTTYQHGRPTAMHFSTHWFMTPFAPVHLGELDVLFSAPPMHWVPVHLSTAEAPVMRVQSLNGWQIAPPG